MSNIHVIGMLRANEKGTPKILCMLNLNKKVSFEDENDIVVMKWRGARKMVMVE